MNSNEIRSALHQILRDRSYYERADRFSKLSRKSIGYKNGARLVLDVLKR
jgi:UDP:flavonoid glycosyltransferase YjiC (YdhE family)